MDYRFKTKPYGHQLDALEASHNEKNYALFCEMGTGKSKILLDNIAMLYDKGKINGALVVAPKGVYKTGLIKRYQLIYQIIYSVVHFNGLHPRHELKKTENYWHNYLTIQEILR